MTLCHERPSYMYSTIFTIRIEPVAKLCSEEARGYIPTRETIHTLTKKILYNNDHV